ncbi:MAG: chromosome segregation protein SMC, partial [Acidiferrobacterales bacterium]
MRLKKIKLSGFKSFVDPISIPVSGNLIGIVGPNGCGKSNIIDAVRWVMGESSAKHLRGDTMADVIFSGSTARKAVGKASVELIFDNSDGGAPGQYASYAEISIRREAARDGQSDYFLNRTRCRRKDITDLFLGTGLGPHSYSILEQNAVTRIIESKPEELRAFFEEAAGVSRYKERRRETENRIKHTRENLSRVEDIRKELDTQLQRLQRQSRVAEKYKELKHDERLLRAQLHGLRWRNLDGHLRQHDASLATRETALEGLIAELRAVETTMEQLRVQQTEAGDHFSSVQAERYAAGSEVDAIEQSIQHARDTRQQRLREQEQLNQSWAEANRHRQDDTSRMEVLQQELDSAVPVLAERQRERAEATRDLASAEQAMLQWQGEWEQFGQTATEQERVRDIQGARIASLNEQIAQLRQRQTRLREESETIDREIGVDDVAQLRIDVVERDRIHECRERELEDVEAHIRQLHVDSDSCTAHLEEVRGRIQTAEARLASLSELQAAALGKHDATLNEWLAGRALTASPRLAGMLDVEPGWEPAVERVLGADLTAVCVPRLDGLVADLAELSGADLTVLETMSPPAGPGSAPARPLLLAKIRARTDVSALLSGIYTAETLEEALELRTSLLPHESVVTRSGAWLGRNWMAVTDKDSARAGMLGREREIESLGTTLGELRKTLEELKLVLAGTHGRLADLEQQRQQRRRDLNEYNRERAAAHSRLGHKEARMAQLHERHRQIADEQDELTQQLQRGAVDL